MSEQKTAYEQSIEISRKAIEDALKTEDRQDPAAQMLKDGRAAFRVAYDYFAELVKMWGSDDAAFFTVAAVRANEAYQQSGQNQLAQDLLIAIFGHFDRLVMSAKD